MLLDIVNIIKIFNGLNIGSLIVYICVLGFVENGEDFFIFCNGIYWINILFVCFGEFKIEFINDFENIGIMILIVFMFIFYLNVLFVELLLLK